IVSSVVLVALLALVFAVGTGQHFTTFGLYAVSAVVVAMLISLFRWSYETASGAVLRSMGVRRHALLVGDADQGRPLRRGLGATPFAGTDWAVKRAFDLAVSALVVVAGLPFWLLIAALIKLDSRGPVIYADPRVGLGERQFRMLKFRTMVAGAAGGQAALE